MKDRWEPEWYRKKRQPSDVGINSLFAVYGAARYLWGNVPALDILQVQKNETETIATDHDFNLLFAASGDPRNVIKTIVGLPDAYAGKCVTILNDHDFIVVARNAIMFLIALTFEPKTAVPMMIHLWYSALLPVGMMRAVQTLILPMIEDVCGKIKDRPDGSLQAKSFDINGRTIRIVLEKDDWSRLAELCRISTGLTAEAAQRNRRSIMLDPKRVDFRDRAMLSLPRGLREGETYFRKTGVLLPFGCATKAFDTPNP
jgi:hypothetical protein